MHLLFVGFGRILARVSEFILIPVKIRSKDFDGVKSARKGPRVRPAWEQGSFCLVMQAVEKLKLVVLTTVCEKP